MARELLKRTRANGGKFDDPKYTEISDYIQGMTEQLFAEFPNVDVFDILHIANTTMNFVGAMEILKSEGTEVK